MKLHRSHSYPLALARGTLLYAAIGVAALLTHAHTAYAAEPSATRLNALGPENTADARRAGRWDVVETIWSAPGAPPQTTTGLIAERRMIGQMLEETLRPPHDASAQAVRRIDYLTFNRVEARYEYVSMDMRSPVGLMTAQSYVRGDGSRINMLFQPFAVPGAGASVDGQMLRMEQVIVRDGPDHDRKEQYFIMADGIGTRWLAHRYVYTRRR